MLPFPSQGLLSMEADSYQDSYKTLSLGAIDIVSLDKEST